ncbi:unnamed protein product [Amoebophrya sp. A120]|nr:unnamed protein product [Amoebophrya sp. A120]|eukprot:GSA120T00008466001.1
MEAEITMGVVQPNEDFSKESLFPGVVVYQALIAQKKQDPEDYAAPGSSWLEQSGSNSDTAAGFGNLSWRTRMPDDGALEEVAVSNVVGKVGTKGSRRPKKGRN